MREVDGPLYHWTIDGTPACECSPPGEWQNTPGDLVPFDPPMKCQSDYRTVVQCMSAYADQFPGRVLAIGRGECPALLNGERFSDDQVP